MPIYEYRCMRCRRIVEVMQKMGDSPLRKCRKCAGRLEKLISRTSFQLKGGGWYDQGYSNSTGSDPAKPKAKPPASSSDNKTDKTKKAASAV